MPPHKTKLHRQTRSEHREACQIVLEFLLSRLDLASLWLGIPTLRPSGPEQTRRKPNFKTIPGWATPMTGTRGKAARSR